MTQQRVATLLPSRERAALAELCGKVRELAGQVGSPLGWDTLRAAERVELAGLLPREHHGAIRGTFAACIRESDRHALETMAECVMSLSLYRHGEENRREPFDRRRLLLSDLGGAVEDLVHVAAFLGRGCRIEEEDGPEVAALKAAAEPIGAAVLAAAGELQAVIDRESSAE